MPRRKPGQNRGMTRHSNNPYSVRQSKAILRLLLGVTAPLMTPSSVDFSFLRQSNSKVMAEQQVLKQQQKYSSETGNRHTDVESPSGLAVVHLPLYRMSACAAFAGGALFLSRRALGCSGLAAAACLLL